MQQFQNMNPNFYGNYMQLQQQYNPYMQRMENLQQFQQAIQQPLQNNPNLSPGLNMLASLGKVVESMDMVKVADIPMDGNMYYFPKADGAEIYSKQFMPNGQTRILTFKPVLEDEPSNLSDKQEKFNISAFGEVLESIHSEIRLINEKIDKIPKPKIKKEAETNE